MVQNLATCAQTHLLEPWRPRHSLHLLVETVAEAEVLERRGKGRVVEEPRRKAALEVKLGKPFKAEVPETRSKRGGGGRQETYFGAGAGGERRERKKSSSRLSGARPKKWRQQNLAHTVHPGASLEAGMTVEFEILRRELHHKREIGTRRYEVEAAALCMCPKSIFGKSLP